MAYKFQIGDARLSGSLVQEGNIEIADGGTLGTDSDADMMTLTNGSDIAIASDLDFNIAKTGGLQLAGAAVTSTAAEINLLDTAVANTVVNGKAVIYGSSGEIAASSLAVSDLTDNRVLIAGTSGEIEDDANFTFDGTTLAAPQVDATGLSGSLEFSLDVAPNGGIGMTPFDNSANVADLQISASYLQAAAVADGDEFLMLDSDGSPKREAIADLATLFAGNGLSAANSVMALDLNELSAGAIASGDSLAFIDSDDSNGSKKETVDDLATLFAGNGLSAASAVMALDLNELSAATVDVAADSIAIIDSNDSNGSKKESIADLVQAMVTGSTGLSDSSGVISVSTAGAMTVDSLGGEVVISGSIAGNGIKADDDAVVATLELDLDGIGAATIDVAADSFAFIDSDDSNSNKKETIADLVSAMAGAGLSAASGVLSVQGNSVASKADGDTLAEGYNYFADLSADATVTLPASPSVGDVVTVKAADLTSGANVIINRAGSHTIDGETSIRIESPYGAVTMVYVVANDWRIV